MQVIRDLLEDAYAIRAAGRAERARELYVQAVEIARRSNEHDLLAHALRHVSDLDREAGRAEAALSAAEEAVDLYRAQPEVPRLDLANALRLSALAREALARPAAEAWREAGDLYVDLDIEAGVAEAERHLGLMVRPAEAADLRPLARLWRQGWRDAHLAILPPELAALRTQESFDERMAAALPRVRVLGPVGAPLGFHLIKDDELNQFYLDGTARGTGAAAVLMADAEARLREAGVATPWLACAIGNDRAARFYEKTGWVRARVETVPTETSAGPYPLEVWRYEKRLTAPPK